MAYIVMVLGADLRHAERHHTAVLLEAVLEVEEDALRSLGPEVALAPNSSY